MKNRHAPGRHFPWPHGDLYAQWRLARRFHGWSVFWRKAIRAANMAGLAKILSRIAKKLTNIFDPFFRDE
jgi:hypothetical protein